MNETLLVVDDEKDIRDVLTLLLTAEGYRVRAAVSGEEALALLDDTVGLILLDVRMPGMDGFETCTALRQRTRAPICFLTARTQEEDKTLGLGCGGDDYLVKPFSTAELLARVKALLRRYRVYQGAAASADAPLLRVGPLAIDPAQGVVVRDGTPVALTDIEYRLLLLLARHAGQTLDARTLYESVWEEPYLMQSAGTIMAHMRNLRRKLEPDPQHPTLIKTVWGKGYRVE